MIQIPKNFQGKVYFISRHAGAIQWSKELIWPVPLEYLSHLELNLIKSGDYIVGNLPVPIVAELCAIGAHYIHLTIDMPEKNRGHELSAAELQSFGARLETYVVKGLA